MSTEVLDERARHVALVRAQAALIADSSRPVRRLVAQPRVRSSRRRLANAATRAADRPPPPPVARRHTSWRRRVIAAAALTVQVGLLVLALTLPGVPGAAGDRRRHPPASPPAPWSPRRRCPSRASSPSTARRSRVASRRSPGWRARWSPPSCRPPCEISVVERAPMLRIRRDGTDTLVASDGATLPGIDATPAARERHPGAHRRPRRIPTAAQPGPRPAAQLDRPDASRRCSAARSPPTSGERDDVVSLWTSTGWRAVLGHLDTAGRDAGAARRRSRPSPRSRAGSTSSSRPSATSTSKPPPYPVSGGHPGPPGGGDARRSCPVAPAIQPPPAASSVRAADGAPDAASDADPVADAERQPVIRDHARSRRRPRTPTPSP